MNVNQDGKNTLDAQTARAMTESRRLMPQQTTARTLERLFVAILQRSYAAAAVMLPLQLCCRCWSEAITPTDGRDLQVQPRMLRMAAFVQDFQVSLMTLENADQDVRFLVVFAEVRAETTLPVLNRFHIRTSLGTACGVIPVVLQKTTLVRL
jgi:hypothetical protein